MKTLQEIISSRFRTPLSSFIPMGILLFLLLLSILFFRLPQQSLSTSVGAYTISEFPSGLALYTTATDSHYYSISPLNDYLITQDGYRMALFSGGELANGVKKNKLTRIIQTIGNYFEIVQPSYELSRTNTVTYTTKQVDSNTVQIIKTQDIPTQYKPVTTGITLNYAPDDFVYSPETGSLFTQHSEAEVAWLESIAGIDITQATIPDEFSESRLFTWELNSNQVFIINPTHSGVIIVQTGLSQSLLVNPKDRLIEVVDSLPPTAKTFTSTMTIKTLLKPPQ